MVRQAEGGVKSNFTIIVERDYGASKIVFENLFF